MDYSYTETHTEVSVVQLNVCRNWGIRSSIIACYIFYIFPFFLILWFSYTDSPLVLTDSAIYSLFNAFPVLTHTFVTAFSVLIHNIFGCSQLNIQHNTLTKTHLQTVLAHGQNVCQLFLIWISAILVSVSSAILDNRDSVTLSFYALLKMTSVEISSNFF